MRSRCTYISLTRKDLDKYDVGDDPFGVGVTIPDPPSLKDQVAALNPLAWFMADQGVEEAAGDAAEDNDNVRIWKDQSSNNNDAEQSTAINQPVYNTNEHNGLPAITGDGANTYLDVTSSAINQPYWIALVAEKADGAQRMVYGAQTTSGFAKYHNNGAFQMYAGAFLESSVLSVGLHVIICEVNGSSSKLYIDGSLADSGSAGSNNLDGLLLLRRTPTHGDVFLGDYCEFLIKEGVPSSDNKSLINSYLNGKWSVY